MHPTDDELIACVEGRGLSMAELFLAEGRVYVSEDAGDFRSTSTYAALPDLPPQHEIRLISFLQRLAAPVYESIAQVDEEIAQVGDWEALYDELMSVLQGHGTHDDFGDGDFLLIADHYSSLQHKVECTSPNAFTPSLVADTQRVLRRYPRACEVIFVIPGRDGEVLAYSVYADECVERRGG
jgi:hypothetical protein